MLILLLLPSDSENFGVSPKSDVIGAIEQSGATSSPDWRPSISFLRIDAVALLPLLLLSSVAAAAVASTSCFALSPRLACLTSVHFSSHSTPRQWFGAPWLKLPG